MTTTETKTGWLKCIVTDGQFQSEKAVRGEDHAGRGFSFFADKKCVSPSGDSVKVIILAEESERVLVKLPGQTFENGQTITVARSQFL